MFVTSDDHMSASPSVATVRSALCGEFIAVQMNRTRPAFTAAATYFYVINKVSIHGLRIKKPVHMNAQAYENN